MTQFFAGTPAAALMAGAESLEAGDWMPALLDLGAGSRELHFGLEHKARESVTSWSVGFVIEQVPPLRMMLDGLGGSPASVRATAQSLTAVSDALKMAVQEQATAPRVWTGDAAEAHVNARRKAAESVDARAVDLRLIAVGLEMAAVAAETVRTMIRSAIADLLVKATARLAISSALPGVGQATVAAWTITEAGREATRLRKYYDAVVEMMGALDSRLVSLLTRVAEALVESRREMSRDVESIAVGRGTALVSALASGLRG